MRKPVLGRAAGWMLGGVTALGLLGAPTLLVAQTLEAIQASSLGGDRVQLNLRFSEPPPTGNIFAIENPPRLAVDLPGVRNRASRSTSIGMGPVRTATSVESGDRTRVILNLDRSAPHQSRVEGNNLIVTLGQGGADSSAGAAPASAPSMAAGERVASAQQASSSTSTSPRPFNNRPPEILGVDFERGNNGEGRVILELDRGDATVNVQESRGQISLQISRALIDESLVRRLNVNDFATPVGSIDTARSGDRVTVNVATRGEYEVVSFQSDERFVLEVAPVTPAAREARERAEREFVGERLSLNFQDIEVRSVLQLLADFTELNIVVSDTVQGSITLRLNNVPWDQALDIILTTRGLDKRQEGNVIYVAPSDEIQARERAELEAFQATQGLEPLTTEFIQVNFVKAESIRDIIRESGQSLGGTGVTDSSSERQLLSERGSLTVDPQSNVLIVKDTLRVVNEIQRLVDRLDQPIRQVLIETRIVVATDNFSRDLGVRFGVSSSAQRGQTGFGISGSLAGADTIRGGNTGAAGIGDRLNIALPIVGAGGGQGQQGGGLAGSPGSLAFSVLRRNVLLDLELQALQAEGRGEIVSNPRVLTTNGRPAEIRQGSRIPIRTVQGETAALDFVEAFLETRVTPQITASGAIILDIDVARNDADFGQLVDGVPTIRTRELDTQVRMQDGETVVLGGIYEIDSSTAVEKVPFLGDLPIIRHLFRTTSQRNAKAELLIFVTPRIVE